MQAPYPQQQPQAYPQQPQAYPPQQQPPTVVIQQQPPQQYIVTPPTTGKSGSTSAKCRPQTYETLIFVCRTYCVCSSSTATNSCYRGEDSGERETPGNKLSLTIEEVKFELQMGFGTGLAMAAGVMIGEAIADGEHHHHHHHGRHHQHHRHGHHHHHHGRHHH